MAWARPQGRSRSVDLVTVWLHYNGGIAACDAGLTDRGVGGGWGVARRGCGGGRQVSHGRDRAFWEVPPPVFFLLGSPWPVLNTC